MADFIQESYTFRIQGSKKKKQLFKLEEQKKIILLAKILDIQSALIYQELNQSF